MHSGGIELSAVPTGREMPHLPLLKRGRVAPENVRERDLLKTGLCEMSWLREKMKEGNPSMNLQFLLFTLEVLTQSVR